MNMDSSPPNRWYWGTDQIFLLLKTLDVHRLRKVKLEPNIMSSTNKLINSGNMWWFPSMEVPKMDGSFGNIPLKWMISGVPLFQEISMGINGGSLSSRVPNMFFWWGVHVALPACLAIYCCGELKTSSVDWRDSPFLGVDFSHLLVKNIFCLLTCHHCDIICLPIDAHAPSTRSN